MSDNMDLRRLQEEHRVWSKRNFGDQPWEHLFMGAVEEVGELSHALLKQSQGIRGSWDEHEEAAKDAVGDVVVCLAALCTARGWDFSACVQAAWLEIWARAWTKDKVRGGSGTLPEAQKRREEE